jgi:lipopolysaccharide/colanic/teichoic acid biosynthesis glycosyltransferase
MLQTHAKTQELPTDAARRSLDLNGAPQPSACGRPSAWSISAGKRVFDCACVLLALPVLVPLAMAVAAVVRFTSPGPVLFLQKRAGRRGRVFTIFKFRTLIYAASPHLPITTRDNQRFTSPGPFLRRWKLDELPQLLNVLLGDMSLVGPRPKMPEHAICDLPCRPGLTGMATLAFAEEETILARVPAEQLDECFYNVVLPAKWEIDTRYMERATFLTDLRLLVRSVLRRWESAVAEELLGVAVQEAESGKGFAHSSDPGYSGGQISTSPAALL